MRTLLIVTRAKSRTDHRRQQQQQQQCRPRFSTDGELAVGRCQSIETRPCSSVSLAAREEQWQRTAVRLSISFLFFFTKVRRLQRQRPVHRWKPIQHLISMTLLVNRRSTCCQGKIYSLVRIYCFLSLSRVRFTPIRVRVSSLLSLSFSFLLVLMLTYFSPLMNAFQGLLSLSLSLSLSRFCR
jgi:hypothetical protein